MRAYAAAALLTALALAGCSPDDPVAEPSVSTTPSTSSSAASSSGSSSDAPEVVDADQDLLDWARVPGPVRDTTTASGDWTLTVSANGDRAQLRGPTQATVTPGKRGRISEALIDRE